MTRFRLRYLPGWARINTIGIFLQLGKTLDRGKNIGQALVLCSINVYWDGIDLSKIKTFKLRDDELPKYRLHKGDLLICEGGIMEDAVYGIEMKCIIKMPYIVSDFIVGYSQYSISLF